MRVFLAYLASAVAMAGLDTIWLRSTQVRLYEADIGAILSAKTNVAAAIAFYVVYVAGIVYFGVTPVLRGAPWTSALVNGALFGLFAYATYDLTNLATLKTWSLRITVIDMAWGTILTAASALAGALAASAVRA